MTDTDILRLVGSGLVLAFKLAGPVLITCLVLGLVVSVFQAVFQVQDQAIAFVPKLAAVAAVFVFAGPFMIESTVTFTEQLYRSIPDLIR